MAPSTWPWIPLRRRQPPPAPEPKRVKSVISKQLTTYILSLEEMEAFLKKEFSNYENYNFDVKVCHSAARAKGDIVHK